MFKPEKLDLTKTQTFSVKTRHNLVRIDNLFTPDEYKVEDFNNPEFDILINKIIEAKKNNGIVIFFYGGHVIKCGLSRYVIWLMKNGFIDHIASNGAGSIHDFELAYLGGTSEHVPTAIEDGSFGMWEETGKMMNEALIQGRAKGYGYGESIANYIENNPHLFPYKDDCVIYNAFKLGVPATYHVSIGTDIIQQHPICDFETVGYTSGIDFSYFAKSVSKLDKGVHLNVGSSVTGPEVFLKALSIARNQGYQTFNITTANFDIIPLGDYKENVGANHFHYYYRPRKNVINRPVSMGGTGLYIEGTHEVTIPNMYKRLKESKGL